MDSEKKTLGTLAILRKFFGYREGETMKDFADELKQLTPAEKWEMADLAAIEMGVTHVPSPTPGK